jgi:hypothetical protein
MRTLLFLLIPIFLTAQKSTVRQEIERINTTYAHLTSLRSEVEYVMYATHTGTNEIDRQQAVLSRNGNSYVYKIGPMETLSTSDYTIAADYEDKEILLNKIYSKPQEKQFGLDLETALSACDTFLLSYPSPGLCKIVLELLIPELEKVELLYDEKTCMMKKTTLFYRDAEEWVEGKPDSKARMEIIYKVQDKNPVFAKDLFSIERFVRKVGGTFVLSPQFKNFSFFNQTDAQ